MKCLLTGVAGFVGSHVLDYLLENTDWEIVANVRMKRTGDMQRIKYISEKHKDFDKRVKILWHDLRDPLKSVHRHIGDLDYIVHMAADSHVDDSINRPVEVCTNNYISTLNMLEYARHYQPNLKKFIQYSTDEVYGAAGLDMAFVESDKRRAGNPYSASKLAGEALADAWVNTYGLPIIISRTMNMYGQMQDPEKMIPKTMKFIAEGKVMTIHGSLGDIGSRFWLHAKSSASAIAFLLESPVYGEDFNVPGNIELDNLEIAEKVAGYMGKKLDYKFIESNSIRPGYDRRYSVNGDKIRDLGWENPYEFEDMLKDTVDWTMKHKEWLY